MNDLVLAAAIFGVIIALLLVMNDYIGTGREYRLFWLVWAVLFGPAIIRVWFWILLG